MDKENVTTKAKMLLLFALVIALVCAGGFFLWRRFTQQNAEQQADALVSTITYDIDNNLDEIEALLDFPHTEDLGWRSAAVYYRTLTKLYMLQGGQEDALKYSVDAHIKAEIGHAYDIMAWLYADLAQLYINMYTFDCAQECIETAMSFGKEQQMDPYFNEYCNTILALLYAQDGQLDEARQACALAEGFDVPDLPEYQSLDLRRELVKADIAWQEHDFSTCQTHLSTVRDAIDRLEYPAMDMLWASGIYSPYLRIQVQMALAQEDYELVLHGVDSMYALGMLYGQIDGLMNLMAELIWTLGTADPEAMPPELSQAIQIYTSKLLLKFPTAFQDKSAVSAEHHYTSNLVAVSAFLQQHEVESFYRLAAQAAVLTIAVFTTLILLWHASVERSRLDGLTGAYTRKHFNRMLTRAIQGSIVYGVIMYDIDFFKQINDGFGHEAGDIVLHDISKKTMSLLDSDSKLYRYGGDEFCIICMRRTKESMAALAENIRASVEAIQWQNGLKATLSIGVAVSVDCDDVMATVDEHLYKSKEAGRNHVSW